MPFRYRSITPILAGLSLAASTGPASHAAETGPESARIVLANFSFTPSDLHLNAGKPVVLHFVNEGSGGHNFVAPEFFAAASMDDATRGRLRKKGAVELAKGESVDVTLTPRSGNYEAKCTHFLHAGFGMKGTITVR